MQVQKQGEVTNLRTSGTHSPYYRLELPTCNCSKETLAQPVKKNTTPKEVIFSSVTNKQQGKTN